MKVTCLILFVAFCLLSSAQGEIKWRKPIPDSCKAHQCSEDAHCKEVVTVQGLGVYSGCHLHEHVPPHHQGEPTPPRCCLFAVVPETEEYYKQSD